VVSRSSDHGLLFHDRVIKVMHGRHCEFAIGLEVVGDKSLVPRFLLL